MKHQKRQYFCRREQKLWILNYIKQHHGTDVCDTEFHGQFYSTFSGKRKEYFFGAEPVYKAMKLLSKMYKDGEIERGVVSLGGNWQPGFPKWAYVYFLSDTVLDNE